MRIKAAILVLGFISIIGCGDEKFHLNKIIGKWKFVKSYSPIGGHYLTGANDQNVEEYRLDKTRIVYDYAGVEIGRCGYDVKSSQITYSGRELNGDYWEVKSIYWFKEDTLVIRADGGFEFIDNYWVQTK